MTQETAMCNYTKKRDAGMREEISAHLSPRRIAGYNVKKLKTRTLTFIYSKSFNDLARLAGNTDLSQ